MNRRRKMIAYRRSHRYLEGMKIAGLICGLRGAIRTFVNKHLKDLPNETQPD